MELRKIISEILYIDFIRKIFRDDELEFCVYSECKCSWDGHISKSMLALMCFTTGIGFRIKSFNIPVDQVPAGKVTVKSLKFYSVCRKHSSAPVPQFHKPPSSLPFFIGIDTGNITTGEFAKMPFSCILITVTNTLPCSGNPR
jgi:hypothetical protein